VEISPSNTTNRKDLDRPLEEVVFPD